ncbi:MAG TPA: trigger factor [Candidatus Mediterraneibacter stercorigallinarum]|uniref:peptidylprolyl isomerase n=1 Tax=Candidatus Mediterraneibacter stercorigallinarum TaxID=2838686 RepID=A0A9D2D9G8_9FIRM|nr:trigger factor [Candidatus Mediterraneibacter stercorigallinarum]
MKKKMIAMILAAAVAGTLAGCSNELSNEYVTVTQYKGLEVSQVEDAEVTDEQVEQVIQTNLESTAEKAAVTDRAAEMGDWVNIDFTGYMDGVAFDNGSAQAQDLQLGSGSYIGASGDYAGFEDQIAGHQTGEEFDITVQFPENYTEEMAGKVADFHIVLNEIYTENVPELTDEWVQSNSEDSENVDQYREEVRKQLEEQAEASVQSQLRSLVQEALLENIEVEKYPEDVVNKQIEEMETYYTQMAAMYGVELADFIETYLQTTEDDFNARIKEAAQQTAALDQAVLLIAEKENLEPSDEEYEERVKEYAEQAGMTDVDAYKEQVGEDVLKNAIRIDVVTDYLVEECIQVEESDTAE